MKKYLSLVLCGLSLFSCNNQSLKFREQPTAVYQIPQKVSYKLEELCDTDIYEKNITLNIYIEPSEILWDYHKYKEEIFGYVKRFFREQNINCKIEFSKNKLNGFISPDIFGLEVYGSEEETADRYFKLSGKDERKDIINSRGFSATEKGIALMSAWEEFRNDNELTRKDVEKQFFNIYKGTTVKEYILKTNAGLICHEICHCLGLFHPGEINIAFYSESQEVPDIMCFALPVFNSKYSVGYSTTEFQKRMMHSFIAGNNTYRAFKDSKRDLEKFIENLKKAN